MVWSKHPPLIARASRTPDVQVRVQDVSLGTQQRGIGIQLSCVAALGYVYRVMRGREFREENVGKQQKIGVFNPFFVWAK